MASDPFAGFPPRPIDVGEWEDLLLRFELGPRAIRIALDDYPGAAGALLGCFSRLARAESFRSVALDAMRRGEPLPPSPELPAEPAEPAEALQRRFADYTAARARNFAALQRRGLEVWEWSAPLGEVGELTAVQLVRHGLKLDGEVLAEVRSAGHGAAIC